MALWPDVAFRGSLETVQVRVAASMRLLVTCRILSQPDVAIPCNPIWLAGIRFVFSPGGSARSLPEKLRANSRRMFAYVQEGGISARMREWGIAGADFGDILNPFS